MLLRKVSGMLGAGALLGMLLLSPAAMAQSLPAQQDVQPAGRAIGDIALGDGGVLHGQVLDRQGQPLKQTAVKLVQNERVVAQAVTNDRGNFAVVPVKPGVYSIQAGEQSSLHRLWAAHQAPPSANTGLLIVNGPVAARGQIAGLGALGTAAAGAGVVGGYLLLDEFVLDDDDPPASGN